LIVRGYRRFLTWYVRLWGVTSQQQPPDRQIFGGIVSSTESLA
jgi:hypothetical protein